MCIAAFIVSFLGTQSQHNVEHSKSRMGTFVETAAPTAAEGSQDNGWDMRSQSKYITKKHWRWHHKSLKKLNVKEQIPLYSFWPA